MHNKQALRDNKSRNNPNQGSHTNMCQDKLSWDKWDTATLARRFQVWCMTMADIL